MKRKVLIDFNAKIIISADENKTFAHNEIWRKVAERIKLLNETDGFSATDILFIQPSTPNIEPGTPIPGEEQSEE